MTDSNDLNSTEKLLDSIRSENLPPPAQEPVSISPDASGGASLKNNVRFNLCAGVQFGANCLSMALTGEQKRGGVKELVKWENLPYPGNMDMKDSRFPAFLRSGLSGFLKGYKNVSIWAAIDTKDIKLRKIVVPNLPESKLANAAMWALKKEIEFDPVEEVFDYEVISDITESGAKKKNVVAFAGSRAAIQNLKRLFSSAGYSLAGVTGTPFALQNCILTGQPDIGENPVVLVNIRRHRSEIFCLSQEGVLVARSIKTGSHSLVEAFEGTALATDAADVPGFLAERKRLDDPGYEDLAGAAGRLVGKIQRTGEYCSNVYLANEPISKYYFFGETDDSQAFLTFAGEMMPDRAALFTPWESAGAPLGLEPPGRAVERNGVIPAIGIALSDNAYTPNFLYTHKEKELAAKAKKINMLVVAAGLAGLLICGGVWAWLGQVQNQETRKLNRVQAQLAQYETEVTPRVLDLKIHQAQKKVEMIRSYTSDYLSLAVVSELCSLTPENISIVSVDAGLISSKEDNAGNTNGKKSRKMSEKKRHFRLHGVVNAEFTALESSLTGYVIALGDSPLFGNVVLEDKKVEYSGNTNVLKFIADMEIL